MRLTQIHLDYFNARRQPSWSTRVRKPAPGPTIDQVVNAHAGISDRRASEVDSTLALIRMRRRRTNSLLEAMTGISNCHSGHRRVADTAKWAARIRHQHPGAN